MKFVDRNGKWFESAWDFTSLSIGANSLINNIKAKNIGGAIVDGIGIMADAMALALPGIPGGAGAGIKALRGADKAADAAKTVDKVSDTSKNLKFGDKSDTYSKTIHESFGKAKDQNGIPRSQQPDKIIKPNTPKGDASRLTDKNVKQYEFTNSKGEKIIIRQDKPIKYQDGGGQSGHFNAGNTNDNKLKQHHYHE